MFYKLLRYDIINGFRSTARRYGVVLILFCVMFISFLMVITGYNIRFKIDPGIEINLGNALLYGFGGMSEYKPAEELFFRYPAFWLLSYLLLAYITLYYPYDDLEQFGQNILIRSGGRGLWWISKCIWNILSVVVFFLLAWAVFALGCLVSGGSLSMTLSPDIFAACNLVLSYEAPAALIPQTLLLPMLVMMGLNLLQMTLSLFLKPFYSFMVTTAILFLSTYYLSPFCIGNYAMPLRSHLLLANGVGLNTGMLISGILIVVSIIAGGLIFRKRDILKGEG